MITKKIAPIRDMLTIVSGGQTGVDRAALDVAIELGFSIAAGAREAASPRTCFILQACSPSILVCGRRPTSIRASAPWNVRDSDRLMVLVDSAVLSASKGTVFAVGCARALAKPHVLVDLDAPHATARALAFLSEGPGPLALCIGGPRESEAPGIYAKARDTLCAVLKQAGLPCRRCCKSNA